MAELEKIKDECLKKEKIVEELNAKLCEKIILRDLNILQQSDCSIISSNEKNKFIKDSLIIKISPDGTLEIEDRRGTAFLWIFDIQHDKELHLGNVFEFNKRIYSVSNLKEDESNPAILQKLKECLDEFDDTISLLQSDISLDTWSYKYLENAMDVTFNSLQEVFENVLKRKY